MDYQFASVVMHRILGPLRRVVLEELQAMVLANKASNWFTIFLISFILMHNYEMSMAFYRSFSRKRKTQVFTLCWIYYLHLTRASSITLIGRHFVRLNRGPKQFSPISITVAKVNYHFDQNLIGSRLQIKRWRILTRNR
jgi:hypothetical protein